MDMRYICWVLLLLAFVMDNLQSQGFQVSEVEFCPTTEGSWYRAGLRLNCSEDENNRLQYLCIPNENRTRLLEFCYDRRMVLFPKEHCIYLKSGNLNSKNCTAFLSGCPEQPYLSSTIYRFPSCLEINKEKGCYLADLNCPLNSSMDERTSPSCNTTTGHCRDSNTTAEDHSHKHSQEWIAAVVCIVIVCLVLLVIVIGIFIRRRKSKRRYDNVRYSEIRDDDGWTTRVLQNRNNVMLSQRMGDRDVIYKKDKDGISERSGKYEVDCGDLFILNLDKEDEALYQGFHEKNRTNPVKLEIHHLTLFGWTDVTDVFGHDSSIPFNKCLQIWNSTEQLGRSPCEILITQNATKTEILPRHNSFIVTNADQKLVLHAAVLLSRNCLFTWNNQNNQELEEVCKFFVNYDLKISENQKIAHPWVDNTVEEWRTAAAQWNDSLLLSSEGVEFVNDDVEWQTLSVMFQNCLAPRVVLGHMFKKNLTKILMKYFRLDGYQRHENETCVLLPTKFHERFLECIVSDYFNIEEMEDAANKGDSSNPYLDYIFPYLSHECALPEKFVAKYFRTFGYEKDMDEKCICLPPELTERLIKRLGMDIILHKTIKDTRSHSLISQKLRIPEEILQWEYGARKRFFENFKGGSSPMYRARCLIVGCVGAGKTTVLRNLRRNNRKTRTDTEQTTGIEVYEDEFDIREVGEHSTLFDSKSSSKGIMEWGKCCRKPEIKTEGTISVMDFAGQMAYYACHQIYLSPRAIYLLVIDMTKDIQSEVGSNERQNVKDSLFEHWTFSDYYTFWLQSILTYSADSKNKDESTSGNSKDNSKNTSDEPKDNNKSTSTPVIVIATHKDCIEHGKIKEFPKRLRKGLPDNLLEVFEHESHRYFDVGLPPRRRSETQRNEIEEIRQRIAETAKSLPHWGERIPLAWSNFEKVLRQKKKEHKILSLDEIKRSRGVDSFPLEEELSDMLQFYHEIGVILFFPDEHLKDVIIIDIQWFVDAFKHIITDGKKTTRPFSLTEEGREFHESGIITESLLLAIWKKKFDKDSYSLYNEHKEVIIPYMEKLGILAEVKIADLEQRRYYIPSMNIRDLEVPQFKEDWMESSILSFYFFTFLPHFFFYRLVVACYRKLEWEPIQDKMTKNAALFIASQTERNYIFAVAVNKTSIQLQMYNKSNSAIDTEKTIKIRTQIHTMIESITTTFHKGVKYEIGFHCQCKPISITEDDENFFIREDKLMDVTDEKCPLSGDMHGKNLTKAESVRFWTQECDALSNTTTNKSAVFAADNDLFKTVLYSRVSKANQ